LINEQALQQAILREISSTSFEGPHHALLATSFTVAGTEASSWRSRVAILTVPAVLSAARPLQRSYSSGLILEKLESWRFKVRQIAARSWFRSYGAQALRGLADTARRGEQLGLWPSPAMSSRRVRSFVLLARSRRFNPFPWSEVSVPWSMVSVAEHPRLGLGDLR